jgi:flagellar hook assembly protein FlgD
MTQRPGVTVTRLQFVIAALHSTSSNTTVRTFPVVRETWGPGQHIATVRWDGTDDHGRRLPAGRYRIEARVSGTVPLPVICQDGSGHGVELFTGTSDMGLNVVVRVPKAG